ncbi:alpha-1,3-rhamnosyltransferase WapR [Alphaproteobacteria bacterium]|nr:alpha-1,3-rhamnosyltransferase WapR [Alphaproteobacteria bacterium]
MREDAPSFPLVSAVIPAYNHEKYVAEAVASLFAQTYPHIELLVIDDGSTDNTWGVLQGIKEAAEKRFARVSFKTQENRGVCATLNALFREAKGDCVYYLGSDDVAEPDALLILRDFLSKNPDYVLAVGDNSIIDSEGRFRSIGGSKTFSQVSGKTQINLESSDFGSYGTLILCGNHVPNGYMLRTSIVNEITLPEDIGLEDFYLHLQLAKRGKMKYIDRELLRRRLHEKNTSADAGKVQNLMQQTFWKEVQTVRESGNVAMIRFMEKCILFHKKRSEL